eukprot:TRINITY_DN15765_c0_g1_i1.p1 TRINITY_DN15765_c0_g1~~TRINITY_DN15765_c0_g1_i1.p1  ORF type:complete len:1274 (+),score=152.83 TRINITY_DN15765_c0_g1_i1:220-3822(+)
MVRAIRYLRDYRMNKKKEECHAEDEVNEWQGGDIMIDDHQVDVLLHSALQEIEDVKWKRFDLLFGIVLCLNCILIGYEANNGPGNTQGLWSLVFDIAFLLAFSIELSVRCYFSKSGIRQLVTDKWMALDLIVIIIVTSDLCISHLASVDISWGFLTVFRLLRLFRLSRLAKLFRKFESLVILVETLHSCGPVILWSSVLLVVVAYIFGMVIRSVLRCDEIGEDDELHTLFCSGIFEIVVSQLEFATYDGTTWVREIMNKHTGGWVLPIYFAFISITSLGILNLQIGVMMNSAIVVAATESRLKDNTVFLNQHRALRKLRDELTRFYQQTQGDLEKVPSPDIALSTLSRWFPEVKKSSRGSDYGMGSVAMVDEKSGDELTDLFRAANIEWDEVKQIFSKCEQLMPEQSCITVDEFISACMWLKSDVAPLDILSVSLELHHMARKVAGMNEELRLAHATILRTSEDFTHPLKSLNQHNVFRKQNDPVSSVMAEQGMVRDSMGLKIEEMIRFEKDKETVYVRFDGISGVVMLVYMVAMGIDIAHRSSNVRPIAQVIFSFDTEHVFSILFIVEGFLRSVLHYQVEVLNDLRMRMCLPEILFTMDFMVFFRCLAYFPHMMKDKVFFVDVMALTISIVVQVVSPFSTAVQDLHAGGIFYSFRLIRMVRIVRWVRLSKDVSAVMDALPQSTRLALWAIALLSTLVFFFGLITYTFVGNDPLVLEDEDASGEYAWTSVIVSMRSLLQIATFSRVEELVFKACKHRPEATVIFLAFLPITSFGVLNILTGIMVEAAFHTSARRRGANLHTHTNSASLGLKKSSETFFSERSKRQQEQLATCQEFVQRLTSSADASSKLSRDDRATSTEVDIVGTGSKHKERTGKVLQAIWASSTEIVVEFKLFRAHLSSNADPFLQGERTFDPDDTRIMWEDGYRSPSLVFVDEQKMDDFEVGENHARTDGFMVSGCLLFTDVPTRVSFSFSFGIANERIHVWPEEVEATKRSKGERVVPADWKRIDTEHFSLEEFTVFLSKAEVVACLKRIGLRVDQALVLFQKLCLASSGPVTISDFLDGLRRVTGSARAHDLISSKSSMRRMVQESSELLYKLRNCRGCFTNVVEALRGINVVTESSDTNEAFKAEIACKMRRQAIENNVLEKRAQLLRRDVATRRRLVRAQQDKIVAETPHGHVRSQEECSESTISWESRRDEWE